MFTPSDPLMQQLHAADVLALDFETYYSASYSVRSLGYSAYVNDPRFCATSIAVSDGDLAYSADPRFFPWGLLQNKTIVAHNAAFDIAVFKRLQETGVIPTDCQPAQWHDTAALCAFLGIPRSLAEAANCVLHLTLDKAVRRRAADGPDLFDNLHQYNSADAHATARLWKELERFWPTHERQLSQLTITMGFRGITLNQPKALASFTELEAEAESARLVLPWYPNQPPTSPKALAAACQQHNIPAPTTTSTKEEDFESWLEQYSQTEPARYVRAMQEIRSLNRAAKVLQTMIDRVRPDGRIDTHTLYFGASTGRWSGGGHGLNLQNLNRGNAGNADLRACLIPKPGNLFLIADLSQIEPRCLARAAGDTKWLALVAAGDNPYEAHAKTAHNWSGTKLKREDPRLYALCKAERLGLGYGCGPEKFVVVAKQLGGLDVTLAESQQIVADFRRTNPLITALWTTLENAFRARDGKDYRLPLPSGRRLRYFQVDAEEMTAAVTLTDTRFNWYGGKLCENLIQAIARDVFAHQLLAVDAAGLNPVLTVHDEVICEVPADHAPEALQTLLTLMNTPPPWAPDLPLAAEGEIATHYRK